MAENKIPIAEGQTVTFDLPFHVMGQIIDIRNAIHNATDMSVSSYTVTVTRHNGRVLAEVRANCGSSAYVTDLPTVSLG